MRTEQLTIAIALIGLVACKHESIEVPKPDPSVAHTSDLRLSFAFSAHGQPYLLGTDQLDTYGHLYELDTLRFFLSNVYAVDDSSAVLASFPGKHFLLDAANATNDLELGPITAAHLHEVRFLMGLDSLADHADPLSADPPMNVPSMHWGSGTLQGYWYMVMTGRVDSDNSGTLEATDSTFSYRCSTVASERAGWVHVHTDVPDGNAFVIPSRVDMELLMDSIDVLNNFNASGSGTFNMLLMDHLAAAINVYH